MTLNRFEVFQMVVDCGSLTKAGMNLNLTQSGISHAIASLENEFGFSLLNRGKSGISLTENGEHMLKYMREMLLLNEKMMQEAAGINGIETGTVRIGTFSSVAAQWLPCIIKKFQDHYPGIQTKLFEGDYLALEQELLNGEIDCAFLSLPTVKSLNVVPLKKDKMLCIVSDQHPLCKEETISFMQLEKESLIMPKKEWGSEIEQVFKKNNIKPKVKFEVSEDQTILAMVQNNLGISIRPEMTLASLPANIRVLNLETDAYRSIGIASKPNASPATKKFIDCAYLSLSALSLVDE